MFRCPPMEKALAVAFAIAALPGCATTSPTKDAERAEKAGRYDHAVALYTQALTQRPDDPRVQQNLRRAKLRASASHALEATRRMSAGGLLGAGSEPGVALTLNPSETSH